MGDFTLSLFHSESLFVWCCLLHIDVRRDLSDRRLWTDAAILSCVVLLLGINLPSIFGMRNSGAHLHVKTATVLIGTAISLLFMLPLAPKRRFHRWEMFFVTCGFPMLTPMFGLAALLHQYRLRFVLHPKRTRRIAMVPEVFQSKASQVEQPTLVPSPLRFGFQEMMWITAGIAIFISVGWMSLMLIPLGMFFAVAFGGAAWMSHHPVSANALNAFTMAILYLMPVRESMLHGIIPSGRLFASIGLVFGFLGARSRCLAEVDASTSRTGDVMFDRALMN